MSDYSLDSPSNQLRSQESEESVMEFVCPHLSEEIEEVHTVSPKKEHRSCFK